MERLPSWKKNFPARNLPDGAMEPALPPAQLDICILAGLYQALLDWKLARQSNGVFMLRIEDTDTKREVDDASKIIIYSLSKFGIDYDEGPGKELEKSKYGNFFSIAAQRYLSFCCCAFIGDRTCVSLFFNRRRNGKNS